MSYPEGVEPMAAASSPDVRVEQFQETFMGETEVFFHVIHLVGSVFVWVGSNAQSLSSLATSIPTRFSDTPSSSLLMDRGGAGQSDLSSRLSVQLAKRCSIMTYVSYNLASTEPLLVQWVLKKLVDKLPAAPQKA